jgi:hypothetical protein
MPAPGAIAPRGDRRMCLVYDTSSACGTLMDAARRLGGIVAFCRTTQVSEREGMMDEPTLKALSQRVELLEQANLRWKRLASWALASLGIVVLLGAAAGKRAKSPAELRAQRIVLVDKAEKGRPELTVTSENQPELALADDAGKPRLMLALSKYGEPTLSFIDAGGTRRIVLSLDLYGAMLRFTDDAGNPRAALVVPSEGEPELELLSKDDKLLWHAP